MVLTDIDDSFVGMVRQSYQQPRRGRLCILCCLLALFVACTTSCCSPKKPDGAYLRRAGARGSSGGSAVDLCEQFPHQNVLASSCLMETGEHGWLFACFGESWNIVQSGDTCRFELVRGKELSLLLTLRTRRGSDVPIPIQEGGRRVLRGLLLESGVVVATKTPIVVMDLHLVPCKGCRASLVTHWNELWPILIQVAR